ncbi:MAG: hypothetical protein ABJN39_07570 [Sulfitobacter sp.]|uniref:hypothetical protein n=1 Tax=Alphaproteobacteria TaxID=28211 RepID=UPI00329938D7
MSHGGKRDKDTSNDRDKDTSGNDSNATAGAVAGAAAGAIAGGGDGGDGGNATATIDLDLPEDYGSDDDTIDADQTNNGDNQANSVNSTVDQSDEDGNNRDNSSDDDINVDNVLNGAGDNRNNDSDDDINVDNVLNGAGDNRDNDNSTNNDDVGNMDVAVEIRDSFRDDDMDDDLIDFDNVGEFEIDSMLADALNGSGNDMAFSFDQANDMIDNDTVNDPDVTYNGGDPGGDGGVGGAGQAARHHGEPADGGMGGSAAGGFYQTATGTGGSSEMGNFNAGGASGGAGHDAMNLNSTTSADASLTQEAFTQNLTLGANIQYNLAETSVVGGNSSDTGDADDAA